MYSVPVLKDKNNKKMKHIIFTYRNQVYQAWKNWEFSRIEKVLSRLGASYWEIG